MSLPGALAALEQIVGAVLPGWSTYIGVIPRVVLPAVLVQIPDGAGPRVNATGHRAYDVPVTFVVATGEAMALAEVMDARGPVVEALDGAEHEAWLGQANVTAIGDLRAPEDAGVACLAVDVTVRLHT